MKKKKYTNDSENRRKKHIRIVYLNVKSFIWEFFLFFKSDCVVRILQLNIYSSECCHHHQVVLTAWNSLSLSCHPSLSSIFLDRFSKLYRVSRQSRWKSLLISQYWHIHVSKSLRECHLCVHPCFSSSSLHVLFILLEWFVRWVASGCTAAVLWGYCFQDLFKTARSILV